MKNKLEIDKHIDIYNHNYDLLQTLKAQREKLKEKLEELSKKERGRGQVK